MIRFRSSLVSFWPHLLLVLTFGTAGLVALHAHDARKAQLATAREALRDYGSFASWSYEQHARRELEHAFWEMLSPVNHGEALHVSPDVPEAADLAHFLPFDSAGCFCHTPAYVPDGLFALRVGDDALDVAVNLHPGPERGLRVDDAERGTLPPGVENRADPPRYGPDERRAIAGALTEHARGSYRVRWRMAVVPRTGAAGTSLLGYTLMPTARGDTMLYAVELPPGEVERLFGRVLDQRELLPATFVRDRPNREILRATVQVPGGARLFSSGADLADGLVGEGRFPERLGALTVRTAIGPEVAGDLLVGGVPESRFPVLLAVLALAALLAVVSVGQLRKEGALARQRTDFVSAVSHELRTPLAQVRLYLETLRLGRFRTEEQRNDALERIDRETGRLAHLVENILHFARSEHGSAAADPSLLSLRTEVHRAVESFEPLASAGDAAIETEVDPEVAVRADRRELRRVLVNLLDNAVKYGPRGQTVTVRGRPDAEGARVEVEDQGPGVPPSERERIWEPFHRGGGDAERSAGGSGIGLALVREIARRHGGDARVEEGEGGGARFVVTLPGERVSGAGEAAADAGAGRARDPATDGAAGGGPAAKGGTDGGTDAGGARRPGRAPARDAS